MLEKEKMGVIFFFSVRNFTRKFDERVGLKTERKISLDKR